MRHGFGTRIANTPGVTLPQVKELMGHSKIETTMRYVHTSQAQLEGAISLMAGQNVAKLQEVK